MLVKVLGQVPDAELMKTVLPNIAATAASLKSGCYGRSTVSLEHQGCDLEDLVEAAQGPLDVCEVFVLNQADGQYDCLSRRAHSNKEA